MLSPSQTIIYVRRFKSISMSPVATILRYNYIPLGVSIARAHETNGLPKVCLSQSILLAFLGGWI